MIKNAYISIPAEELKQKIDDGDNSWISTYFLGNQGNLMYEMYGSRFKAGQGPCTGSWSISTDID